MSGLNDPETMKPKSTDDRVARQMESMRRRFEELCRKSEAVSDHQLVSEAMQELFNTLEELSVATEELRQQNDELSSTRESVEAERRHYQELFEFAPDGYLVTDPNGIIQESNENAARLLHVRRDFLVGKPLIVYVSQQDHASFRQLLDRLQRGEEILKWQIEMQPRDLPPVPTALTLSAIREARPSGKSLFAVRWLLRDVTERQTAAREIESQVRRISVLRDINVAITSTLNLDTILNVLLDQLTLLFPYPFAATVRLIVPETGKLEHVICRGIDAAQWNAHAPSSPSVRTQEVLRSNAPVAVRNINNDPQRHTPDFYVEKGFISYLGVPLTIQGEALGIFCLYTWEEHEFSREEIDSFSALAVQAAMAIHNSQLYRQLGNQAAELQRAHDDLELRVEERTRQLAEANEVLKAEIGERQLVEKKLRESERHLSAFANELEEHLIASDRLVSIGELASSIAHEFNNPMQIILGFAQDLDQDSSLSQSGHESLKIIQDEVLRCRGIIRNILDFARPVNAELKPVIAETMVQDSLKLLRGYLEKSRINIEVEISPHLPPIHGDSQQLKQVLINLFFNAVEAMPQGGTLALRAASGDMISGSHEKNRQEKRRELIVSVSDNGVGISPESIGNIFRPFFTTKKRRGTGLGLSVCERIMRAHGGSITVESKQGAGATFYLRFPLMEASRDEGVA
jgi:PAS domain S-box-containing protein